MPDRDSIPITMKNGSRWRPDFIFDELLDLVDALALPHYRDVQEGAVEELRLDLASRREDENVLSLDDERRVHNARKINKGLAMELSVSASLTYVGLPKTVRSFCKLNKRGVPNYFAGKGDPDILTQPSPNKFDYRIVCEVSANREMGPKNFRKQLKGALDHCRKHLRRTKARTVYGFLLNHANVGKDKAIQDVYLDFVKKEKLKLRDAVRLVPMRAAEFVTALRRLHAQERLRFDSRLLATSLNGLHRKLRGEIPTQTQDWMAKDMVENIRKALEREPRLFDLAT